MFSPFVIPFCIGVISLLVVSIVKYCRWISRFDKKQRSIIRHGILSWKIIPALWETFRESLLHWRITKHNILLGYMHRSLAFGWFLLIVVGALQALLAYPTGHPFWVAIFFNYFEPRTTPVHLVPYTSIIAATMDILLLYVFSGLSLAILKKCWSRPMGMKTTTHHNITDHIAKAALWCIFPLRLLAESATSAIYHNGSILVSRTGQLLATAGFASPAIEYNCWTLYSLSLGTFFVLMPFTRYMHIFTEVLLIYFRTLGVTESTRLSGYTLFGLSACSRCGICIDGCPIHRHLGISDTQGVYLLQHIRNKDLWDKASHIADTCMACGRCSEVCPVQEDLAAIRQQTRVTALATIDRPQGYQYLQATHPFNAVGRIAYFGGCMSHLTPATTQAMETIFTATGQRYCYLDQEKTICCGRPLQQQGLIKQAEELRRRNQELIKHSHATMLVTSCPICYRSFTQEYNLNIPVMHHTQYLAMLIQQGRIKVSHNDLRISYHDPCELGRGCGIYDQPRQVIQSLATLLHTKEEAKDSLCCGHNLGNTVLDTHQQALIRDAALRNLMEPHPDIIATACPACKKSFMRASNIPVKDIAELVAERLEKIN